MIKLGLLGFLFLLNVLAIDIDLFSGAGYIALFFSAIYFCVGFVSAFMYTKLRKSLMFLVINVFVAFCVGMAIYGYTKAFPTETNHIGTGPFENFLNACIFALVLGAFGIFLNFGTRMLISRLRSKR